ncbi:RNA-binding region RNP-1 domain-containing protein [Tieghemostelium lacteum]|uniref:RNA-binding region RNP-1 domain-containing protein n=1 Tax=Tieghemostelium lacteum TaxID=361077 RepID=A0A151Z6T9_TIELA|nr:RNA-binding region RNP-1 domain-containing protein [Tieghemostelium lacteum]|eukprot:KYQ89655.1 RNA-binding region RNP-1 domain-containing protein [Tieghemostelium lacteum]
MNPYGHPGFRGAPPGYPQNLPPPPFGFVPPPGFPLPNGFVPPFGFVPPSMVGLGNAVPGIPHQIQKAPIIHQGAPTSVSTPLKTSGSSGIQISSPAQINLGSSTGNGGIGSGLSPPIPSTISVFIGKIPSWVDDIFIKLLIEQCGSYSKWIRGSDASGKLKGFGFCEFDQPEGALRALRLLNDLEIDEGKKLSVKVEDKVQALLNDFINRQKSESTSDSTSSTGTQENGNGSAGNASNDEQIDDIIIKETFKALIEKNQPIFQENKKKEMGMQEAMVNTDIYTKDRKDLTNNEKIKVIEKEIEKEVQRERERDMKKREREYREFIKEVDLWESRERAKERDRERDRDKEREKQREIKNIRLQDMEDYSDSDDKLRKLYRSDRAIKYRKIEKEEDLIDRDKEQEEINLVKQQKLEEQIEKEKKLKLLDDNLNKIRFKKPVLNPNTFTSTFNNQDQDDDEYNNIFKKKQTFIPLDYNEIKQQQSPTTTTTTTSTSTPSSTTTTPTSTNTISNRSKEEITELISKIPTEKEDVLKMKMEWDIIDKLDLIEKKMRPWITKKTTEFMGGIEEPLLNDHIIELLKSHLSPSEVIEKLLTVLEGHAELFVVKMFRMLSFLEKSSQLN